jgi:ABC-type branched-subunit amino acid transport system substrate-binding protein
MTRPNMRIICTTLALALATGVAACGKSDSASTATKSGGIKAGPGVTSKTITLGVLTDLSGVFAPLGKPLAESHRLYWQGQNKAGGVCGRQVKLIIKDHGYDPQKAVTLYRDMSSKVLSLQELLGSPVAAALLPTIERDGMYTQLAGWPGSLLSNKYVQITGTTYDVEAINGVDYLMKTGKLKQGDKLGHVYFEGDYGESALQGTKYAAGKDGLELVQQKIKPTDTDLTAQVSVLKRAGVKAIVVSAAPPQTASVAGVAKATGLNVPIVANGPGFAPQLLGTPAAGALTANLYLVTSLAPPSLDKPTVQKVTQTWTAAHPKEPPAAVSVIVGWAQGQIMTEVLRKACANKDLTRSGVLTAFHQLSNVDTGGLVAAPLNYTKIGEPSERAVYIARVDAKQPGATKSVAVFESDNAKSYNEAR